MDRVSIPRIRRVRLKGGADVTVLPDARRRAVAEIVAAARSHVEVLASDAGVNGYVLLWWDRSGDYRCGWRHSRDCFVGMSGLPAFVHSVMTREVTQKAIGMELDRPIPQGDPS